MTRLGAAIRARLGITDLTPGAGRGLLYILVLMLAITAGSYYQSSHSIIRVTAVAQSQCQSNKHLGTVPVPVKVPAGQTAPSRFGIRFVVDARQAWRLADCPGRLGPPSAGLVHWAKVYKIPVT